MDAKTLKELVKKAESDPQFFHALVFNPDKALQGMTLSRKDKGKIVSITPEEVIGVIVGEVAGCGSTCDSSCTRTCGQSCGYTTRRGLEDLELAFGRGVF